MWGGSSAGLSPPTLTSVHLPWKVQGTFGNQGTESPGGPWGQGVAALRDRSLPSVPPLHPGGTVSPPSLAAKATSHLAPLLKCQNLDKLVIFLQSAKSQWIIHKTCSKGHILAFLFVCWPSFVLSLALISRDLFLQLARWVTCPRCGQSVLPLPFPAGWAAVGASVSALSPGPLLS